MLDLAKLESGLMELEKDRVDVTPLIRETVKEFTQLANDANVKIDYQTTCETVTAEVDPIRFRQVIRNLLSNAVKFSPAGGTVRVTLEDDSSGDNVEVVVADEGPGIPEDEVGSVFEKFIQSSRTKTGAGGTGLGLAISREIVLAHHGHIWARNRAESGAEFRFIIPTERAAQSLSARAA